MTRLAANIIARDEEANIATCLTSLIGGVDQIYVLDTGSTDKTVEIARSLGATVFEVGEKFLHTTTKEEEQWAIDHLGPQVKLRSGDKLFQFADARNHLLNLTPKEYDWIVWIDADDILKGKENLKKIIAQAEEQHAQEVFFNYLYHNEFNPDGSIKVTTIEHLRERLFKNDGTFKWVAGIHETLIDQKENKKINSTDAIVIHTTKPADMAISIERNVRNLEWEVKESGAEDPRPIYYLAKAYFDLQDDVHLKEAERLIKAYLNGSGWAEERAQAWEYISWIRLKFNDHKNAVKAVMNSFIEEPHNPSQYVTLATCYTLMGDWAKALHWIKLSAHVPQPMTTLIMNPRDIISKSLGVIFEASLNSQQLDEAWGAMYKLIEMFPEDKGMQERWQFVNQLKQDKELTLKAIDIARHLMETGQRNKIQQLIASLPDSVASNQMITNLALQAFPPRIHEDNEISIFCGPGFEIWNPKTIEEKGSGGSEEAVYRLSKELAKIGYKVTVFADPGDQRGMQDGVQYRNYYEMNWNDEFNILITWRRADAMDMKPKAKKHYLWVHDIPNINEYTTERLENVDKVIVLSAYQASLLEPRKIEGFTRGVPAEKLFISQNGVSI